MTNDTYKAIYKDWATEQQQRMHQKAHAIHEDMMEVARDTQNYELLTVLRENKPEYREFIDESWNSTYDCYMQLCR